MRKAISQIQEVQTAIKTFQVKYNQLPGDFDSATEYWPDQAAENGDNDGDIVSDGSTLQWEGYNAWHHLGLAGFLKGSFAPVVGTPITERSAYPFAFERMYLHIDHTRDPQYGSPANVLTLHATPDSYSSWIFLYGCLSDNWTSGQHCGLWPSKAEHIDAKLDDGRPHTGRTTSIMPADPTDKLSCAASNGSNIYNTDERATWGNCGLWIGL